MFSFLSTPSNAQLSAKLYILLKSKNSGLNHYIMSNGKSSARRNVLSEITASSKLGKLMSYFAILFKLPLFHHIVAEIQLILLICLQ